MQKKDLTGKEFGYLTVLTETDSQGYWKCLCRCGKETVVKGASLRNGNTKSCGCLRHKSRKIIVPNRHRRPAPCIDIATYITMNSEFIVGFAKTVKPYIAFDMNNMIYTTRHNMKTYGPFDNPLQMLGHALQFAVGELGKAELLRMNKWRATYEASRA